MNPSFVLLGSILLSFFLPRRMGSGILLLSSALTFLQSMVGVLPLSPLATDWMNLRVSFGQSDSLSWIFSLSFSAVLFLGQIFIWHEKDLLSLKRWATFYAASSLYVLGSRDWISFFIGWECMALAAGFVIFGSGRSGIQTNAAYRYMLLHTIAGAFVLGGILFLWQQTATIEMGALTADGRPESFASWLILLGILFNAAVPPLHAWLTDTYPRAHYGGSVFLSAFTTKTAVYILLRTFAGAEILLYLGVVMALYGVAFAIVENNVRRLLSYHIVSQVGYMVAAAGLGTDLAINGGTAHAFSHVLYKSVLFMGVGAVIYSTGKNRMTELPHLFDRLRMVFFLYLVGAVSISGFPPFNGFVSKSIVVESMKVSSLDWAFWGLQLAGIGTFLSTTLKLPQGTFFGSATGDVKPVPINMILALSLGGLFCLITGIFPGWLYARLPFEMNYAPYTLYHFGEVLQIAMGTLLGFWFFRRYVKAKAVITLDFDWFYRRLAPNVFFWFSRFVPRVGNELARIPILISKKLHYLSRYPFFFLGERGRQKFQEDLLRFPIGFTIWSILAVFCLVAGYLSYIH